MQWQEPWTLSAWPVAHSKCFVNVIPPTHTVISLKDEGVPINSSNRMPKVKIYFSNLECSFLRRVITASQGIHISQSQDHIHCRMPGSTALPRFSLPLP